LETGGRARERTKEGPGFRDTRTLRISLGGLYGNRRETAVLVTGANRGIGRALVEEAFEERLSRESSPSIS
jgi:hypothetical protein